MTKYPYILFVLLLASFSSCQTVEQLSIDYMLPAEISFPNETSGSRKQCERHSG